MCTPGGAAATAKGIGTIRDGKSEDYDCVRDTFDALGGGFIAFFCLQCIPFVE